MINTLINLQNPNQTLQELITAGEKIATKTGLSQAVIGISGGVDSSLALYIALQVYGATKVHAFLLPYADQDLTSGQKICAHYHLPLENIHIIDISKIVSTQVSSISNFDQSVIDSPLRQGNLRARTRMSLLFDQAAKYQAVVIGTENLSEQVLGYFTLHGDEASSIEYFDHLYKTQVIQLAQTVMPPELAHKTPAAELGISSSDEEELGFSYEQADQIIYLLQKYGDITPQIINQYKITIPFGIITKIIAHCAKQKFKKELPYQARNFI